MKMMRMDTQQAAREFSVLRNKSIMRKDDDLRFYNHLALMVPLSAKRDISSRSAFMATNIELRAWSTAIVHSGYYNLL